MYLIALYKFLSFIKIIFSDFCFLKTDIFFVFLVFIRKSQYNKNTIRNGNL